MSEKEQREKEKPPIYKQPKQANSNPQLNSSSYQRPEFSVSVSQKSNKKGESIFSMLYNDNSIYRVFKKISTTEKAKSDSNSPEVNSILTSLSQKDWNLQIQPQ